MGQTQKHTNHISEITHLFLIPSRKRWNELLQLTNKHPMQLHALERDRIYT
jgi:hypothetical protein